MTTRLSLALLVAASGLRAQAPERFPLPGDAVAIYNLAGFLRVEAGSGADVIVELTRGGRDAAKLKIETGTLRDRNALRVIYPDDEIYYAGEGGYGNSTLEVRDDGTFGDDGDHPRGGRGWGGGHRVRISSRGDGLDAHADLRVLVPAGKRVAVHLAVGRATISNVNGTLFVDVSSANVSATGTKGSLTIDAGSGNVDVSDAQGDVNLDTGSGDISLNGVTGGNVSLDTGSGNATGGRIQADVLSVDTGSGDVEFATVSSPDVKIDTGSGNVRLTLDGKLRALDVDTGSGDVTLNVPATLGGDIYIDTGSGGIDLGGLTVQVTKLEKDHVEGRIGTGTGHYKIETGSGEVRLVKS
jgi:lia operon protein LiaG